MAFEVGGGTSGSPFGVPGSVPGGSSLGGGVPGTQTNPGGSGSAPDVIPGVALYGEAAAAALAAYQQALATINGQRHNTLQQYGYMGTINPQSGTITSMKVDPNNPYGLYQNMLYGHGVAQEQARNAADARGLGHVGLGAQGVWQDHRSFGQDSAQLSSNLMNTLEGLQSNQDTAYQNYQNTLWQAELAQLQAQIAAGGFNTSPPPADSGQGANAVSETRVPQGTNVFTSAARPYAVRVRANQTGASANKKQGIFSIH